MIAPDTDYTPRPPVTLRVLVPLRIGDRDHAPGEVIEVIEVPALRAHDLLRDRICEFISNFAGMYRVKADGYAAKRFEMPATATVVKATTPEAPRRIRATASTDAPDRHGDIIEPSAWSDLTAYKANPLILRDHDSTKVVGKAVSVAVIARRLEIEIEFIKAGVSQVADETYELVKAGCLNALSVGFRILAATPLENGRGLRISKAELLEVSIVGIPAQAQALIHTRAMSLGDRKALVRRLRADGRRAEVDALRHALPPARIGRPTKAALRAEIDALKHSDIRRKYIPTTCGEG